MRFIGSLPDAQLANRFGDYLTALGIANSVEQGSSGFAIWIHNDDHVERAKTELTTYLKEPGAGRFAEASKAAQRVRDEQDRRQKSLQKNFVDVRTSWAGLKNRSMPLTIVLVAISLLVGALTRLNTQPNAVEDWLSFGTLTSAEQNQGIANSIGQKVRDTLGRPQAPVRTFELKPPGLHNILHGEVWRLITPIFLHYGVLHLVFNMMWLIDLGGMIERKRGTLALLGIVLATGILANIAQFYWSGPSFGGMSGVVYGLFGYVWIKSSIEPQSGVAIGKQTVSIMLAWLVMCMIGIIPHVANAAHLAGLITGMVLAHAPYSMRKLRRKQGAV
jgi:GlpG protein